MKKAILLAIPLSLAATASFAQDNATMILTQCRDVAETGNFVGSDEVLVSGKVCKVQKVAPAKPQTPSSGNPPEAPVAPPAQIPTIQTQIPSYSPVAAGSDAADGNKPNDHPNVQPLAASPSKPMPTAPQKALAAPDSPVASVTFITIRNGSVIHLMPDWAMKWVRKNEKKYPGVRFQTSDQPVTGVKNFVVAFSGSSAELQGFQPVTHTDTSTSTNPVAGSGTVTDNQGEIWNYTYNGTVTTTTTTTTHEQVPYTRTSNTLYVTAFNEQGEMVAQRWHVYSSQSGGDSANALGYNLGNALAAINARGHMLKTIVDDLVRKGK